MEWNVYRKVECVHGAEIFEVDSIDLSVQDILRAGLVDLKTYERGLQWDLNTSGIPVDPHRVGPLLPVTFTYQSGEDGNERTIRGLVVSDSYEVLIEFAIRSLTEVPDNGHLESLVQGIKNGSLRESKGRNKIEKILRGEKKGGSRNAPLSSFYCQNSRRDRQVPGLNTVNKSRNAIDLRRRINGEEYLFIGLSQINHIQDTGLEYSENDDKAYYYQMEYFRFALAAPRDLQHISGSWERKPATWDLIHPPQPQNNLKKKRYSWQFDGRRGHAEDPSDLPVGLCRLIEERGKQIPLSISYPAPSPLTFLDPVFVTGGKTEQIKHHLSSGVDESTVRSILNDFRERPGLSRILEREWFVRDMRDPLRLSPYTAVSKRGAAESHFRTNGGKSEDKMDASSDSSSAPLPVLESPEVAAYILGHCENGIYTTKHMSSDYQLYPCSPERTWFALCNIHIEESSGAVS